MPSHLQLLTAASAVAGAVIIRLTAACLSCTARGSTLQRRTQDMHQVRVSACRDGDGCEVAGPGVYTLI